MSGGAVLMPVALAKVLLDSFWDAQWETRNAAENVVCAYGCGEPYEDFTAHTPTCLFLPAWEALAGVRRIVGNTDLPRVSGEAPRKAGDA